MILCVYGLTGRRAAGPPVRGMAGERLRMITAGTLAAVVGELPRFPAPSAENLRRYDRVIRRLSERLAAMLPARYGTSVTDPDELMFILRSRQQSLRTTLAKVRGRVQVTVRVVSAVQESAGPSGASRAGTDRTTGASYLRSRAAAEARERNIPGFEPVRTAVRRWVRDERVEKRAGIASVYHLIPRASAGAYRLAVERAAAAAALRVVVTGPFPPYAFSSTW